jgi:hypothetical protein
MILPSPEIWHRDDFNLLCNWRKLWTAIEVGVDRAEFSQCFLSRWQGFNYLGIDAYEPYPEMPWDRNADYLIAVSRYERYARIAKLIRGDSRDVAEKIKNAEIGFLESRKFKFIYIDGAHDKDSVIADMTLWWEFVGKSGILAGHDFDKDHPGVTAAVTQFSEANKLTVYITQDVPASWYIYKSGIPGADWIRNTGE